MTKNFKRLDIINKIYYSVGYPKSICESLTNDIFELLKKNLKDNDVLKLKNFGTFKKKYKKERIGRNPRNKEKKIISARNVVTFKPSNNLKKKINN